MKKFESLPKISFQIINCDLLCLSVCYVLFLNILSLNIYFWWLQNSSHFRLHNQEGFEPLTFHEYESLLPKSYFAFFWKIVVRIQILF